MDVYSFRSEFEKLIQPTLRRQFWADYLKGNYLAGSALSSFGTVRLLLQNKVSSLEKQAALWRIRGDEKIAVALSSLINVMSELTSLAQNFGLQEELCYGGCLEKIFVGIQLGKKIC